MYHKLVKSCKYFFEKQPLLVIARIRDGGKTICTKSDFRCLKQKCCISVDLSKLSSKLWLTGEFDVSRISNLNSANMSVASKFCRCDNAILYILSMEITLNEFQILALFFKIFRLTGAKIITGKDRKIVMIEKVLESIPNVKDFEINFYPKYSAVTASTLENITKLQNLGNLRYLYFGNIPEVFDIEDLTKFIMYPKFSTIYFYFRSNISQEYKNKLDVLIDTINESEIPRRIIHYAGQDQKKCDIMENRYYR